MLKYLGILITGCVTSFYYFPFSFKAFPAQNTKNMMAAVGLVLICLQLIKVGKNVFAKDWIQIFTYAGIVSLIGLISITINNTPDYTYAFYIRIMILWLCAAFCVPTMIKIVHGKLSVPLLVNYLAAVCVFQCVMALLIDNSIAIKTFIDAHVEQGQSFLNDVNRLYGIGANLDVAGSRFGAALIMIAFLLVNENRHNSRYVLFYVVALLVISIIGNMVARTTMVGMCIAVMYLLFTYFKGSIDRRSWIWLLGFILLALLIGIYLYNNNVKARNLMRFAFEGFFSLYERGEWAVASNDRLLKVMVVFPDNIKTWLIGDGYFNNPTNVDPYFTGKVTGGYYMGTDIGYCRFIFYFGLVGLSVFMAYFMEVTRACAIFFKKYKTLFWLLLLINFVVWLKVSTDIFLVFALFLMMDLLKKCQTPDSVMPK